MSQDTRCWYYRDGWTCYRAGGNICDAIPPTATNREHCVLATSRCVTVNPSDTAPVLVALVAQMVVRRGRTERVVSAEAGLDRQCPGGRNRTWSTGTTSIADLKVAAIISWYGITDVVGLM